MECGCYDERRGKESLGSLANMLSIALVIIDLFIVSSLVILAIGPRRVLARLRRPRHSTIA